MNVLLFIDNLGSGGAQRQIVNLAILFKNEGHNVKILVYGEQDFFAKKLIDNNIEIVKIVEKKYLNRILKIRKFIKKGWQDVLISFLDVPNFIACFSAIGKKKWKLITNERSCTEYTFLGIKNKIFKWFEKFADYKVCNSIAGKTLWLKYYPKMINKIDVIYNYVDLNINFTENEIRENEKIVITVAASYQKIKNILNVIEAVNLLKDEDKSKILINWYGNKEVTTGNTLVYKKAMNLINKYSLGETIKLYDATKDIYNKMIESDFVGLFSEYEGLPNTICEAISLGKPIIMTPVSDFDVLVDGNGVLCSGFDCESITVALNEILNIPSNQLILMRENSKNIAEKLFNKNTILEKWLKLFY